MRGRKKVVRPNIAVAVRNRDLKNQAQQRIEIALGHIDHALVYKVNRAEFEVKLSLIAKDMQFVVNTVRDIDTRTKEMRSVQYASAVPQGAPVNKPEDRAGVQGLDPALVAARLPPLPIQPGRPEGADYFKPLGAPVNKPEVGAVHSADAILDEFRSRRTPRTPAESLSVGMQPGQAPPCLKCGQHRDAGIHILKDASRYHEYQEAPKPLTIESFFRSLGDRAPAGPVSMITGILQRLETLEGSNRDLKNLYNSLAENNATLRRVCTGLSDKALEASKRLDAQGERITNIARSGELLSMTIERVIKLEHQIAALEHAQPTKVVRVKKQPGTGNAAMYAKAAKKR